MSKRGRRQPTRGVPKAVEKRRAGKPVVDLDMDAARETWLLDLLAFVRESRVAPRIDVRGHRSPVPPVILPSDDGAPVVAYETATALRRLKSRHRAFSQIAARYSPLVIGARDSDVDLRIVIVDLSGDEASEDVVAQARRLADYLEADIVPCGAVEAREAIAAFTGAIPAAILDRNPVAWSVAGFPRSAEEDVE